MLEVRKAARAGAALASIAAVDSVRVRGADDARWRTVASDRVRLPEPRC